MAHIPSEQAEAQFLQEIRAALADGRVPRGREPVYAAMAIHDPAGATALLRRLESPAMLRAADDTYEAAYGQRPEPDDPETDEILTAMGYGR